MLTFIGKDLLLFWRNRQETAVFLLLPILLVIVLNFVFGGISGTPGRPAHLSLGVVTDDHAPQQSAVVKELLDELHGSSDAIGLTIAMLNEAEAMRQLEQGELHGLLRIPAFDPADGDRAELTYVTKGGGTDAAALGALLDAYVEQANVRQAFYQAEGELPPDVMLPAGGYELTDGDPFTMTQYFPIALGALFALFLASTVAERTCTEKRERVYYRIRLTNARPIYYLMGKTASAFVLAWLQFSFILILSHLLLGAFEGKSAMFWSGLAAAVTMYALTVAGLSALYTSAALRLRSVDTANGLFMLLTILFGLLGGGFMPIYLFPDWLQRAGEWTPNGLLVTELAAWFQLEAASALYMPILVLGVWGAVCFLAGLMLYPKRGEV